MEVLLPLFLLWAAIVFSPFVVRRWKSFGLMCAGFLAVGLGVRWGVASYAAADVPSVLVEIGNIWLDWITPALPYSVLFRAISLASKSFGLGGKRLLAMQLTCIAAVPGVLAGPGLWHAWDRRAAPAACLAFPVPIIIGGIAISLPRDPLISVYLGPEITSDARYFFSNKSQRQLCAETENGQKALDIPAIVLKLDFLWSGDCTNAGLTPLRKAVCHSGTKLQAERYIPNDITLFKPVGIRLGDFGIPHQQTSYLTSGTADQRVISFQTKEGVTTGVLCKPVNDENTNLYCQMRRSVTADIDIYWAIQLPPTNLPVTLAEIDHFASSVCENILKDTSCAPISAPKP